MHSQRTTSFLVLVFSACAGLAALLALWHVRLAAKIQVMQRQVSQVDQNRNLALALGNEALEYSKRRPDIRPILETVMLRNVPRSGSNSVPSVTSPSVVK